MRLKEGQSHDIYVRVINKKDVYMKDNKNLLILIGCVSYIEMVKNPVQKCKRLYKKDC